MSRTELLGYCRELYELGGISALSYPSLKNVPKLYTNLYKHGLKQKNLLTALGLDEEYKRHLEETPYKYGDKIVERWNWNRIITVAREIAEREGRLPPALWFQKNTYGSLIQALYNRGHTWDQLREAVDDFSGSNFVTSRNGLRWLSHAEASLSNYLYARGIEHTRGKRYPKAFSKNSGAKYAIYDLHFKDANGTWVDVEIWGDKPNGHNEEKYACMRTAKERFNEDNPRFVGIHHADCYEEEKLTALLKPHIGLIKPFRFDKPTDAILQSTHWSNADELLDYCRDLASRMPDGIFPTEEWLRKRGKWSSRPGEVYNTLSVYIKLWLGGVRNLRKMIGQGHASTQEWDRDTALNAYRVFYETYGMTPEQTRHLYRRKDNPRISDEIAQEAARISNAVRKYAGGSEEAKAHLDINPERQIKWTRAIVLEKVLQTYKKWGLTPNQLLYDHKKGARILPPETQRDLIQLKDAISRHPGGATALFKELGISKPSRPRRRKWPTTPT